MFSDARMLHRSARYENNETLIVCHTASMQISRYTLDIICSPGIPAAFSWLRNARMCDVRCCRGSRLRCWVCLPLRMPPTLDTNTRLMCRLCIVNVYACTRMLAVSTFHFPTFAYAPNAICAYRYFKQSAHFCIRIHNEYREYSIA